MTDRKLSRRLYLTVVEGKPSDPTPGYNSGPIYTVHQYFTMRQMHLRG